MFGYECMFNNELDGTNSVFVYLEIIVCGAAKSIIIASVIFASSAVTN